MPLSSSRIVQSHIKPRAARQSERTGTAQHHRPNATRAVLATTKPRARSLLTRLLTKRAGAKTSYNLLTYSSMECAAWARIKNRKTSWPLCSTRTLESYYRLCCWQATLPKATSFSRGLSTKYPNVGYDCRASGLLDVHPSRGLWGIDDAKSVRKSTSRTGGRPTSRSPDHVLANRSYVVC